MASSKQAQHAFVRRKLEEMVAKTKTTIQQKYMKDMEALKPTKTGKPFYVDEDLGSHWRDGERMECVRVVHFYKLDSSYRKKEASFKKDRDTKIAKLEAEFARLEEQIVLGTGHELSKLLADAQKFFNSLVA